METDIEPLPEPTPEAAHIGMLQCTLDDVLAPWVKELNLQVLQVSEDGVGLWLPVTPRHVHAGGVLCGQTLMAACDTAMVLAIVNRLGHFRPMTTVQLQTSFLRPVPGDCGGVQVNARLLRMGRSLVFGEVQVLCTDGALATHATTTYALL